MEPQPLKSPTVPGKKLDRAAGSSTGVQLDTLSRANLTSRRLAIVVTPPSDGASSSPYSFSPPTSLVDLERDFIEDYFADPVQRRTKTNANTKTQSRIAPTATLPSQSLPAATAGRNALDFEEDLCVVDIDTPSAPAQAPMGKKIRTAEEIRMLAPNSHAEPPKMIIYHRFVEAKIEEAMDDPLPMSSSELERRDDGSDSASSASVNVFVDTTDTAAEGWSLVDEPSDFGRRKK